jgi:hypothetical protein
MFGLGERSCFYFSYRMRACGGVCVGVWWCERKDALRQYFCSFVFERVKVCVFVGVVVCGANQIARCKIEKSNSKSQIQISYLSILIVYSTFTHFPLSLQLPGY